MVPRASRKGSPGARGHVPAGPEARGPEQGAPRAAGRPPGRRRAPRRGGERGPAGSGGGGPGKACPAETWRGRPTARTRRLRRQPLLCGARGGAVAGQGPTRGPGPLGPTPQPAQLLSQAESGDTRCTGPPRAVRSGSRSPGRSGGHARPRARGGGGGTASPAPAPLSAPRCRYREDRGEANARAALSEHTPPPASRDRPRAWPRPRGPPPPVSLRRPYHDRALRYFLINFLIHLSLSVYNVSPRWNVGSRRDALLCPLLYSWSFQYFLRSSS